MGIVGLFEKVYDRKPILTVFSERMYYTVVSIMKGIMWKVYCSLTLCLCLETIIDSKWQKQASLSIFRAPHRIWPAPICLKISAWIAKSKTSWMIALSTQIFSHWSIPLIELFLGLSLLLVPACSHLSDFRRAVKKILIHPDYIIKESEKDRPDSPNCKYRANK